MATHNKFPGDEFLPTWSQVDVTYTSASSNSVILNNTDGSRTVLASSASDFTFTGSGASIVLTGGTITSLARTDATGATTYESITQTSYLATAFQSHIPDNNLSAVFKGTLSGNDVFNGSDGNDNFTPFAGNDVVNGGAGFDSVSYNFGSLITGPITVSLGPTSTVVGDASVGTDTLVSVERVSGTSFNDTFTLNAGFAGDFGNFAEFEGNAGNDTINGFGGNGTTRVAYLNAAAAVFVDLANGTSHSIAANDAANVGVDTLHNVTAVRGSQFGDTLTAAGGIGQFQFFGLGGNDTIIGTAHGDPATDYNLARYDSQAIAGIAVSLGTTSTVTGGTNVGTDTLTNIEAVRGTAFADTFVVNNGFSAEFGLLNEFQGLGGNDTVTGNGYTRISYGNALAAVTATLQNGTGNSTASDDAAGVGSDTFTGVNQLVGSAFDDTLYGSNGVQPERFRGEAGNDYINGFGGSSLDNVDYRTSPTGINADLTAGTAADGYGTTDTLVTIFGIRGSEFNDVITGDSNDNQLVGRGGNDVLNGGAGNDVLVGDAGFDPWSGAFGTGDGVNSPTGNDMLNGGAGLDTLYGGRGSDKFIFDSAALTDARAVSPIYDHIKDYDQGNISSYSSAEGDQIDLSALLSDSYSHGSGQPISSLVQLIEDSSGTFAKLQIDPDGANNGAHWLTIAQLDNIQVGNNINVILDNSLASGTSLAAPAFGFHSPISSISSFGATAEAGGWTSETAYPRALADVNGDGLADIVGFGNNATLVSLATGGGQFANPIVGIGAFGAAASGGGWTDDVTYPRLLADVNGDGMADIVGFGNAGALVSLATGGGHFAAPIVGISSFGATAGAGGWSSNDVYPRELADVNGDGMADIVGFGNAGALVSLATGDGNFAGPIMGIASFGATAGAGGWTSQDAYPRELADVNGDGMADIVGFGNNGVLVSLATGGGHFASPITASPSFGATAGAGGWSSENAYPRELADINGDGKADIVAFGNGGVFYALGQADGTFGGITADVASFGRSAGAGGWTSEDLYPRLLADVTGDHRADIVGFGNAGALVGPAHDFFLF